MLATKVVGTHTYVRTYVPSLCARVYVDINTLAKSIKSFKSIEGVDWKMWRVGLGN